MLKELYKIIEPWWVCEWTLMDEEFNAYDTSCENPWCLEEGTPEDNKMIYCPACGRKTLMEILRRYAITSARCAGRQSIKKSRT